MWLSRRLRPSPGDRPPRPHDVALGTAAGLGLHNLSEGLAIGGSAASGATSFALILVIGFALHNATEGSGSPRRLTSGERPSGRSSG